MPETASKKQSPSDIKERIHPNTLRFYTITEDTQIKESPALDLLNAKRLDIVARYIYAKSKITGNGCAWAKHTYSNLIQSQSNNFTKGEMDPGRTSMEEYLGQFDSLIESIKKQGFDSKKSIIPTCQNTIIDGAHRIAAALALGIENIETAELSGVPQIINYNDMQKFGMDPDVVNELAREFVNIKPGTRCVVLFPSSISAHEEALKTFTAHFEIDFERTLPISFDGMVRLQTLLYGEHEWWTDKNAHDFAKKRINGGHFLRVVFFQETTAVRPVKEAMRQHHECENHALHTTDTHDETVKIANIFFNKNALFWLNSAIESATPRFDDFLGIFTDLLKQTNLKNNIAIDTGGVMALHGLRDVRDLDYISISNIKLPVCEHDIALHEGEYEAIGLSSEEVISNPKYHFILNGVKFASLDTVAQLKKHRDTTKDLYDLSLIRYLKKKDNLVWSVIWGRFRHKAKYLVYIGYHQTFDFIVSTLRHTLPQRHFETIRATYKKLKGR